MILNMILSMSGPVWRVSPSADLLRFQSQPSLGLTENGSKEGKHNIQYLRMLHCFPFLGISFLSILSTVTSY